jgi:cell fate regulator YaaT (PSP1 superfamily)
MVDGTVMTEQPMIDVDIEALIAPPAPKDYNPRDHVVGVKLTKIGKFFPFDYSPLPDIQVGDRVIVQNNAVGLQMGEVRRFITRSEVGGRYPIPFILRRATPADLLTQQQWQERDVAALIDCREKAAQMGRYKGVKFVTAEYNFNGSLLNIFFTNEAMDRVDTSQLRNSLSRQLNVAVEFKQIGAREVAKLQGGLGACGIPRCCSTFLTDFSPVTLTMAKAQGIALTSTDLLGACGRLRCCLSYEYEQYVEARRHLPGLRKRVGTPHGEGRVVDLHPMEDEVSVQVDEAVHRVHRNDLVPLQELADLKKAAGNPCSKNETGGCDCGAKRKRGSAEELLEEMAISPSELAALDSTERTANAPQAERSQRKGRRRGGGQRQKATQTAPQAGVDSPAPTQSDSKGGDNPRKPARNQRRRRNNRNRQQNRPQGGPSDGQA